MYIHDQKVFKNILLKAGKERETKKQQHMPNDELWTFLIDISQLSRLSGFIVVKIKSWNE